MQRINRRDLEILVNRINEVTGSPKEYAQKYLKCGETKHLINVGHYHLDGAYGGWKLVRTMNDGGGIEEITYGFVSKRELYGKMQAFLKGIEVSK